MGIMQMAMGISAGGIVVPIGLIIPYTQASNPDGWGTFSSANNRFIVGAGSSYGAGSTGGATTFSASGTLSTTGSHGGSLADYSAGRNSPGSDAVPSPNISSGSHSHTFNITATAQDVYKNFRLIKSTAEVPMPADGILLGVSSLTDLTNVETSTDRFLRAASSYGGTGGSSSVSGSATTSSNGSHVHTQSSFRLNTSSDAGSPPNLDLTTGAHTHSASISGSLNTKRIYVSAWTNAASEFDLVGGGIAMWESATPPDGWAICNGAGGTPDMRDYFVRIGTTGNHGSTSGNNSCSWSVSASGSASHNHTNTYPQAWGGSAAHASYSWSHTHTGSGSTSVVPPYYGLYFIQYQG